jgi:hypothetical protein
MGRGSVQAVSDILLLRGVDAGIVRKDTLSYLDRKDFAKDIRNQFVYVAKMFNEEMHVLAPRTITSMRISTARPWWSICRTVRPS